MILFHLTTITHATLDSQQLNLYAPYSGIVKFNFSKTMRGIFSHNKRYIILFILIFFFFFFLKKKTFFQNVVVGRAKLKEKQSVLNEPYYEKKQSS